ncbi:zinc-dependent peptidase [Rosistilla oblonga]|uniref:M90 family metallopeptidase n=1 Tax=Rosistilla oblonga TaxID=2527990 RepID=UPI003A981B9D
MIFSWIAQRRRDRIRRQPMRIDWSQIIDRNVAYVHRLNRDERAKLESDALVFIAEKNWEGCQGLTMNDEIRVTIAAQISLLCLGFTDQFFDMVQSILVYPDVYTAKSHTSIGSGVLMEGVSHREGEAWYRGPVILSWADVLEDGDRDNDGNNLVLHEFAHQLDMLNGRVVDGTPPLETQAQFDRWQTLIEREYEQLVSDCQYGRSHVINSYGAEHISEFFAVATETFFERPLSFRARHPELYEIFSQYYRQNPAARFDG